MRKAAFAFVFLSIAAIALAGPAPAWCETNSRCAISKFETEFEKSEEIFIGTVTAMETRGDEKIFTFRKEKYWKGADSSTVEVSVFENPRFQSPFRIDGRFLVFAKLDEEGRLFDGRCSRTTDLDRNPERAEGDIEKLGPGKACGGSGEKCG